jgi:hypothetical protein
VASSSRAIVGCRKARRYLKSNTTDDDFRSGAHYSDVACGLGGGKELGKGIAEGDGVARQPLPSSLRGGGACLSVPPIRACNAGLDGDPDGTTRTGVATTLGLRAAILSKPRKHQENDIISSGAGRSMEGGGGVG